MHTPPEWLVGAFAHGPNDSADLRWAVETASHMWDRGDALQTLTWLRHAADRAAAEANHARRDALARAAAALARVLPPTPDPAPWSVAAQSEALDRTVPVESQARPTQARPGFAAHGPPTQPFHISPDSVTYVRPADTALVRAAMRSDQEQPPEAAAPAGAGGAMARTLAMPAMPAMGEPPPAAAAPARGDRTVVMPMFDAAKTLGPEDRPPALEPMRALRVAVSVFPGGKMAARPLADDEAAAQGEEEALLVPLGARTPPRRE